jgi:hypothetical protein
MIKLSLVLILITFSSLVRADDVFTLYSTNFPNDHGRSGVATFDLAKEPLNSMMCQEVAHLFQVDFERRKKENGWGSDTKMRYWCEKGRFKK